MILICPQAKAVELRQEILRAMDAHGYSHRVHDIQLSQLQLSWIDESGMGESARNELLGLIPKGITRLPSERFPVLERWIVASMHQTMRRSVVQGSGNPGRVAFQGAKGAYSELAIRTWSPEAKAEPMPSFESVFQAVRSGSLDAGMIPLENALTGSIHENFDHLDRYDDLWIAGEVTIRIKHHLIGRPGVELKDIKRVYSHPQGLLQSAQFLSLHPEWEQVPFYDTAGSVAYVASEKSIENAAIASNIAAEVYGMQILAEGIETDPNNYTRFGLLVRRDCTNVPLPQTVHELKASVMFSVVHRPGALLRCMQILADEELNLTKIESRPILGKPWEYRFYLDVDVSSALDRFLQALSLIEKQTDHMRLLGVYPRI